MKYRGKPASKQGENKKERQELDAPCFLFLCAVETRVVDDVHDISKALVVKGGLEYINLVIEIQTQKKKMRFRGASNWSGLRAKREKRDMPLMHVSMSREENATIVERA